ncbi:hypothetical protein JY651_25220 [Pyxidicoccus parkwayensis]|uniref:Uncharacterized protein n=1 Tax=Pyxidicoccus parkwayensis TaxID=2813578 RepID=A0ABX7NR41_9BACT|nr:hypothetical protein [Pyxidicoccus parkwaysis]QSQ18668.1 hypothetical protein JY651_25220 [Pyxidicoccus parkwaysis]
MSNTNAPAELPPDAPAELVAKRDRIIPELEKQAKTATGTLQQVMRKMAALISNTKPGAALDGRLYQDVKDAFSRHLSEAEKNPALAAMPPVLVESVEWMQAYLNARGFSPESASAPAAAAPAKAPAAGKAAAAGPKDAFESGGKKHASLTGEAPPPPAAPLDAKKEQKELESFKAWMKNPSLGKLKG